MGKQVTTIEQYVIEAVRKKRIEAGFNPNQLSLEIGLNRNTISRAENPKIKDKYNFNQLNEIAKVLRCKIADFFPDPYLEENTLEEYQELHPRKENN